jgi:hypothetical protein
LESSPDDFRLNLTKIKFALEPADLQIRISNDLNLRQRRRPTFIHYPLYLYPPSNTSFVKRINNNQDGRQIDACIVPMGSVRYFDSKVVDSMRRAGRKVCVLHFYPFIQKSSSNPLDTSKHISPHLTGTFIKGERLSPEGLGGEPYELKSDDIVASFLFILSLLIIILTV